MNLLEKAKLRATFYGMQNSRRNLEQHKLQTRQPMLSPKGILRCGLSVENPEIGTELELKVKGTILLLVVCSSSSLWLYCLTVNDYLLIYLYFLCVSRHGQNYFV